MRTSLRLGGGAGFAGDRLDAPVHLAEHGALDYLVLECLAERTIALAQLRRRQRSGERLRHAARRSASSRCCRSSSASGIRLVSNLGAANPLAAADAIVAIAHRLQIPVKVAAVTGDDVLDALDLDAPTLEGGVPLSHYAPIVSANAYLGAEALLPALASGADIVDHRPRRRPVAVRRAAHARVRLGARRRRPPRARHRRRPSARMRGTIVRRLLRRSRPQGHPRHGAPGLSVRRRRRRRRCDARQGRRHRRPHHARHGDRATAVRSHRSARLPHAGRHRRFFDGDARPKTGADRVAVRGARGRARPSQLKVSVGYLAGYVGEGEIGYAGTNAIARAQLAAEILRERLHGRFAELRIDLVGSTSLHGRAFDSDERPYEIRLRVAAPRAVRARRPRSSATRSKRCTPTARPAAAARASTSTSRSASCPRCSIARGSRASVTLREWGAHAEVV